MLKKLLEIKQVTRTVVEQLVVSPRGKFTIDFCPGGTWIYFTGFRLQNESRAKARGRRGVREGGAGGGKGGVKLPMHK